MAKRSKRQKPAVSMGGLTRRTFLTTAGAGAVGLAAAGRAHSVDKEGSPIVGPEDVVPVRLVVNGRRQRLLVEPRWSLLYVLREELGLSGAKEGCSRGECGACTVLIDNQPRYSCMTLAVEAEGAEITTVEGLLKGEELGEVQAAFAQHDAFQCGFCTSGQVMAVEGLLRAGNDPSQEEVRVGVSGNLCRCGAYTNILKAASRAGELRRAKGGSS